MYMNGQTAAYRQTKYCTDIEMLLNKLGHATNTELIAELRIKYPGSLGWKMPYTVLQAL